MILYRSLFKGSGGHGIDYSSTYTCSVNGELEKGSCAYMFANDNVSWSKNIVIGTNVNSCKGMFMSSNFNKTFNIPNWIEDCSYMFYGCTILDKPITIGTNVTNCYNMFRACIRFNSNIYILSNGQFRRIDMKNFLGEYNGSVARANIHFNSILDNQVRGMTHNTSIAWTIMTNGFYNSAFNIYCYNNYER